MLLLPGLCVCAVVGKLTIIHPKVEWRDRAHMKFSALFPVIVAAVAAASEAQSIARPRIIVAISVDEFSADLFTEYRPLFKAGLHRLQTGVVFPAGYQSHAATETCPGHSTILTGSRPARTGIDRKSVV